MIQIEILVLKDQFIGMNQKKKVRIKIPQINLDIFSNYFLDYLFLADPNRNTGSKRFET